MARKKTCGRQSVAQQPSLSQESMQALLVTSRKAQTALSRAAPSLARAASTAEAKSERSPFALGLLPRNSGLPAVRIGSALRLFAPGELWR